MKSTAGSVLGLIGKRPLHVASVRRPRTQLTEVQIKISVRGRRTEATLNVVSPLNFFRCSPL